MEKLFLEIIGVVILAAVLKVALFYINIKSKDKSKKPLTAQEVIRCGHMHPTLHKQMLKDMIIDYSRDEELEDKYKDLRDAFKNKLQNKEISRGQILGIEEYLRNQLEIKKKYDNNAHAIYSMLKSPAITLNHISTISNFINN
ncbi:MAG: hypothetical protein ACRC68_16795 [Clostridium sp.]